LIKIDRKYFTAHSNSKQITLFLYSENKTILGSTIMFTQTAIN